MADSRGVRMSPAAAIRMHCRECGIEMHWRQFRRAWFCLCGHNVPLGNLFREHDAALLIECGTPLDQLSLQAEFIELARMPCGTRSGPNGERVVYTFVELPWELPADLVARPDSDFDAEEELRQLLGQKPWARRGEGA